MSDESIKCSEATPSGDLLRDLMDPNIAKSEREWFAAKEIAALKADIQKIEKVLEARAESAEAKLEKVREWVDQVIKEPWKHESATVAEVTKAIIGEGKK